MTRNYEAEVLEVVKWFDYDHLPPHLSPISAICQSTALSMVSVLEPGPELLAGLNRLLESKDWFVRQAVADHRVNWSHDVSAEYACFRDGGHYWMSVPVGENNRCSACGTEGARNMPPTDEEPETNSV